MSSQGHNGELWCKYDFEVNKYHWIQNDIKSALPIRKSNLLEVADTLNDAGVSFWLQGKTLLGASKFGSFLDDHDDDIGVDVSHQETLLGVVREKLEVMGFQLIRNNADIISYVKNGRYVDICLFKKQGWQYGYANKWFSRKFFRQLDKISFLGTQFSIPCNAEVLLGEMYSPSALQKAVMFFGRLLRLFSGKSLILSRWRRFLKRVGGWILNKTPQYLRVYSSVLVSFTGVSYKKISEDEFLALLIEPSDSFNWKWRKPHLDILTNSRENDRVVDILSSFKDLEGLDRVLESVVVTDTSKKFKEPHNYDPRFWQSGNNFFIYNVKYQFRRGVIEYQDANTYIEMNLKPLLYSEEYYSSLDEMSEADIENLVRKSSIEVTAGAVTGGKHRVCAMLGRILAGKSYVPFWAIVK